MNMNSYLPEYYTKSAGVRSDIPVDSLSTDKLIEAANSDILSRSLVSAARGGLLGGLGAHLGMSGFCAGLSKRQGATPLHGALLGPIWPYLSGDPYAISGIVGGGIIAPAILAGTNKYFMRKSYRDKARKILDEKGIDWRPKKEEPKKITSDDNLKKAQWLKISSNKALSNRRKKRLLDEAVKPYISEMGKYSLAGGALGAFGLGIPTGAYGVYSFTDPANQFNFSNREKLVYGAGFGTGVGALVGSGIGLLGGGLYGAVMAAIDRHKARKELQDNGINWKRELSDEDDSPMEKQSDARHYIASGLGGTGAGFLGGMLVNKLMGRKALDKRVLILGALLGAGSGLSLGHYMSSKAANTKHEEELWKKYLVKDSDGNDNIREGMYYAPLKLMNIPRAFQGLPFVQTQLRHSDLIIYKHKPFSYNGMEAKPMDNGKGYYLSFSAAQPSPEVKGAYMYPTVNEQSFAPPGSMQLRSRTNFVNEMLKNPKDRKDDESAYLLATDFSNGGVIDKAMNIISNKNSRYYGDNKYIDREFALVPSRKGNINCHSWVSSLLSGIPDLDYSDMPRQSAGLGSIRSSRIKNYDNGLFDENPDFRFPRGSRESKAIDYVLGRDNWFNAMYDYAIGRKGEKNNG